MADTDTTPEAQDQAEVFDETHLDEDGREDVDFEEMEPVIDVTRPQPTRDTSERDPDPDIRDNKAEQDRIEAQANALLGLPEHASDADGPDENADLSGPDEIELVFTGLMRNQKGAQASAAHWEAKRLSDEDLSELGYGQDTEQPLKSIKDKPMNSDSTNTQKANDDVDGPIARRITPEDGKHDQLKDKLDAAEDRQEALVDEAVEETMDASDPPSPKHIT